jgi:3-deoxy-manno-octulosonate cytidylyltransferase (CMP-KDO synthetase)
LTARRAHYTLRRMNAAAVIPARYASTRFPGKPLANETGKYLIQHVYEQVSRARSVAQVIVATDDERIRRAVQSFGGRAVMTRADHPSGTDRVAEVAAGLDAEIIVNVQGDEPEIEPGNIDQLVRLLANDAEVVIGTLACPFPAGADPRDPNAVKVVLDGRGRALYFSRALVPYPRDSGGAATVARPPPAVGVAQPPSAVCGTGVSPVSSAAGGPWLLPLGIYAYRRDFLLRLAKLPPTPLEQVEKLEQLRALENGYAIAVAVVERSAVGIDTPADYAAFVERMRR